MYDSTLVFVSSKAENVLSVDEVRLLRELGVAVAESFTEAVEQLESENRFVSILIAGNALSEDAEKYMRLCSDKLCALTEMQVVVSNDPSIHLQSLAYELGVRNFWPSVGFSERLRGWLNEQIELLNDPTHPSGIAIRLGVLLAQKNLQVIGDAVKEISEESKWDFRMANVLGHYLNAQHDTGGAEEAFANAQTLNPMFLPAVTSLAVAKLNNGKGEDALRIFQKLELVNPRNPDRKALMAAACADLGRWDDARRYAAEALQLDPSSPKGREVNSRLLFEDGKIDEAIAELGKCEITNDYFISKLNDEGIRLSRDNQVVKAIALYEAAYKLAPDHLRYKLSYNIALALRRQGEPKKALVMAERAQRECPHSGFDKIKPLLEGLRKEVTGK